MPPIDTSLPFLSWPLHTLPRVRLAARFLNLDRNFPRSYDSGINALYAYHYPGRARIGSQEYEFEAGDMTLSPAGVGASFDIPKGGYNFCIHFETPSRARGPVVKIPLHLPLGTWKDFAFQKCWHIFNLMTMPTSQAHEEQIASPVKLGNLHRVAVIPASPVVQAAASAALQELLLWLAMRSEYSRPPDGRGAASQHAVEQAAQWLVHHLDHPITVPDLAREMGLSQDYLARRFREHFGITIPRYLLAKRIEHAQHLLETTQLPIKAIGNLVGMPDAQHFNKQFRMLTAQSPSAYRSQTAPPAG